MAQQAQQMERTDKGGEENKGFRRVGVISFDRTLGLFDVELNLLPKWGLRRRVGVLEAETAGLGDTAMAGDAATVNLELERLKSGDDAPAAPETPDPPLL